MNNLDNLRIRAIYANNDRQRERMIKDKQRSFHRALLYSYQSGWIKKDTPESNWCRALINPDKVKFDYDEKILSVGWEHDFHPGDTFEWPKNSNVHWIILKQEMTELAYFRGNIRRCELIVTNDDQGNERKIWGAIRGPVETRIDTIQKAGIVADVPNLSLHIYVARTAENCDLFQRYNKFTFAGKTWEIQASDNISTPGILEATAVENYNCQHDELIEKPVDPNVQEETADTPQINGETFIKPLQTTTYTSNVIVPDYQWFITLPSDSKAVADVLTWKTEKNVCIVTWTSMISGQFVVHYGPLEKTIVVESLF